MTTFLRYFQKSDDSKLQQLHVAILADQLDDVKRLIVDKKSKSDISIFTKQLKHGNTAFGEHTSALQLAAFHGRYEILKYMLTLGVDVNYRHEDRGDSLLHLCVRYSGTSSIRQKCVRLLLSHPQIKVNICSYYRTPLHFAAMMDDMTVLNLLLNHNRIDVNRATAETPLLCAILNEKWQNVRRLLQHPNIERMGYWFRFPIKTDATELICVRQMLIFNGINIKRMDSQGRTFLSCANQEQQYHLAALLTHGAI